MNDLPNTNSSGGISSLGVVVLVSDRLEGSSSRNLGVEVFVWMLYVLCARHCARHLDGLIVRAAIEEVVERLSLSEHCILRAIDLITHAWIAMLDAHAGSMAYILLFNEVESENKYPNLEIGPSPRARSRRKIYGASFP